MIKTHSILKNKSYKQIFKEWCELKLKTRRQSIAGNSELTLIQNMLQHVLWDDDRTSIEVDFSQGFNFHDWKIFAYNKLWYMYAKEDTETEKKKSFERTSQEVRKLIKNEWFPAYQEQFQDQEIAAYQKDQDGESEEEEEENNSSEIDGESSDNDSDYSNSRRSQINVREVLDNLDKVSVYDLNFIEYPNFMDEPTSFQLVENEIKEVKRKLIDQIIKPNPQDWVIKEEPRTIFLGKESEKKLTLLVHKDTSIERGAYGGIIIELGKIHYKKGFTDEEWQEIENMLKNSKTNEEKGDKDKSDGMGGKIAIGVAIIIVIGITYWLIREYLF